MWRDFKAFLLKENVLALAIGVVIGAATNRLVTAVVDDFIMPVVEAVSPTDNWRTATLDVGRVEFLIGDFLSALLNFFIIALVAWQVLRLFIRPGRGAAPATKQCAFCRQSIDATATRCAHCTSYLEAAAA